MDNHQAFVSENDGRPSRQRNKTHKGEQTYLGFARGDETRLLGLRKTARPNSGGLNAETRIGGIEPMGKISLLTFLFIGLPDSRRSGGISVIVSGRSPRRGLPDSTDGL